jgi:hypothetical protein
MTTTDKVVGSSLCLHNLLLRNEFLQISVVWKSHFTGEAATRNPSVNPKITTFANV